MSTSGILAFTSGFSVPRGTVESNRIETAFLSACTVVRLCAVPHGEERLHVKLMESDRGIA